MEERIFGHLLNVKRKESHLKLLGDMLTSSPDKFQRRMKKLQSFIMDECRIVVNKDKKLLEALPNFMSLFINCIEKSDSICSKLDSSKLQPVTLDIDMKGLELMADFITQFSHRINVYKFIMTLLNLPKVFFTASKESEDLSMYLVDLLILRVKNGDTKLAEFLSFFV